MIPFLLFKPTSGGFVASFTGGGFTLGMGVGDTASFAAVYNLTGQAVNHATVYVDYGSGDIAIGDYSVTPAQENTSFGPVNFNSGSMDVSGAFSVWNGTGTYNFHFKARRASTGLFDMTSNTITLVVA
jgi:hypothetical protein